MQVGWVELVRWVEFCGDFWHQKTSPGLSCGVVCLILHLSVLVEHRLVTNRHTETQGHCIYRASRASRGKNQSLVFTL